MKKINITLILSLFFSLSFAQTPNIDSIVATIDWERQRSKNVNTYIFEDLFSGIDTSFLTTNIFYPQILPLSDILKFQGTPNDSVMDEANFYQLYAEIYHSFKGKKQLPEIENLLIEIDNFVNTNNALPLIILDFEYNYISPTALEDGLIEIRNNIIYSTNESPFLVNTVFASFVLLSEKHSSLPVMQSNQFYFSNRTQQKGKTKLNNELLESNSFSVEVGTKNNVVSNYKGNKKYSYFNIPNKSKEKFTSDEFPDPNYVIEFGEGNEDEIDKLGLWQACGHNDGKIRKPILLVEGFDATNNRNFHISQQDYNKEDYENHLYWVANDMELADELRAQGFDVLILNFADGGGDIEENAMTTVEVIQYINNNKIFANELVIIGPSMGGLITRYALAYMEQNNMEHQTKLYFSFDTPHQGANVTLGLQHLGRFLTNTVLVNLAVGEIDQLINCDAAKQMLIYHHDATGFWTNNANPHPDFNEFYDKLHNLNPPHNGYPNKCRKIAMANGSSTAEPSKIAASKTLYTGGIYLPFHWIGIPTQILVYGRYDALPNDNYKKLIFQGLVSVYIPRVLFIPGYWLPLNANDVRIKDNVPFDTYAGGQQNFHILANDLLTAHGWIPAYAERNKRDNFIPVKSALDATNTNWDNDYTDIEEDAYFEFNDNFSITINNALTPFDEIYVNDENNFHVIESLFNEGIEENSNDYNQGKGKTWILENIAPADLYLQNHNVTYNTRYESTSTITVGRDVSERYHEGDFTLSNNTHTEFIANDGIYFEPGFDTNGGTSETILSDITCDVVNYNKIGNKQAKNYSNEVATLPKFQNFGKVNTTQIYPNPANNYFTVNLQTNELAVIQIFNVTANLLYEQEFFRDERINLQEIPNGLLLIKITTKDRIETFKIIKQ